MFSKNVYSRIKKNCTSKKNLEVEKKQPHPPPKKSVE